MSKTLNDLLHLKQDENSSNDETQTKRDTPLYWPYPLAEEMFCFVQSARELQKHIAVLNVRVNDIGRQLNETKDRDAQLASLSGLKLTFYVGYLAFETANYILHRVGGAFGETWTTGSGKELFCASISNVHRAFKKSSAQSESERVEWSKIPSRTRREQDLMLDDERVRYMKVLDEMYSALPDDKYLRLSARLKEDLGQLKTNHVFADHSPLTQEQLQLIKDEFGESDPYQNILTFYESRRACCGVCRWP